MSIVLLQVYKMSGKTEIVYKPDTEIDIEEFKLEPTDTDEDAISGGEDIDPLHKDQESQGNSDKVNKRKRAGSKDVYSCDLCDYTGARTPLYYHKKSKHEGIQYPCDQCEYAASELGNLHQHKQSKHEGIRYPCDQCEYAATQLSALKRHKQSKHKGIRYPRDQCEYDATGQGHLKQHKKAKHQGIRYPCDQCKYVASQLSSLKIHMITKHEDVVTCEVCGFKGSKRSMLII